MGKIILTCVLFIAIIGTTLVTNLKKENVPKLWSNLLIMLLNQKAYQICLLLLLLLLHVQKR